MRTYFKYIISLFLTFGLIINDCPLNSQTNSVDYYQFSNIVISKEWNFVRSKTYLFKQRNRAKKTSFLHPILNLLFKKIHNFETLLILKVRIVSYQNISAIKAQHTFLIKTITSSNSHSSLYIA